MNEPAARATAHHSLKRVVGAVALGTLLAATSCESGISDLAGSARSVHMDRLSIQPYPDNPHYWMYAGEPILLVGGSDEDNLFNHPHIPPAGLEAQLDLLASVGGNYVRNTMANRDEGNVWPFAMTEDGQYDLGQWNDEYWSRFRRFLEMTLERGQIVQIEIWDRFDFAREPWDRNPFNPVNNSTYTPVESSLPISIETHPGQRESPFFRSTPEQEDLPLVLGYQRALVDRILSISLGFPHVLYTVSNETNESEIWSAYWADFIHERAERAGREVYVTEMWDGRTPDDPQVSHTYDDPDRYGFIDISQNNHHTGQLHWDYAQQHRERVAQAPRPINNVKIYGGPNVGGGHEEGTRKFWRNLFGGMASSRFHRGPGAGVGLDGTAQAHLRSVRLLTDRMTIFTMEPRNDLLLGRGEDEAYALAEPGRQYAVYFPDGGSIALDPNGEAGTFTLRWLDVLGSEWSSESTVSVGDPLALEPPGEGPWVALLTVAAGG